MGLFNLKRVVVNRDAIAFYRSCMKTISRLEPNHKKIWYDYVRLKYIENQNLRDKDRVKKILAEAREELEWVKSVLNRKDAIREKVNRR